MTSSGAVLAGRTLSDFVITADATAKPGSPQAKLTATGASDGQAIDVKAEVVSKDGRTSIPTLEAKVGDNRLTGAIDLTADFKPEGTIDFNLPDLGLLAAMAGEKVSGDLSGSAAIKTAGGVTSLSLKANGSGIKRGDLTITKPVADISIADVAALAIRGSVKAEKRRSGSNRVTGFNLTFDQQGGRTGFTVDGRYDGGPLRPKATWSQAAGAPRSASPFRGNAQADTAEACTPRPSSRSRTARCSSMPDHRGFEGNDHRRRLCRPTLDISARLNELPAALINTFAPTSGGRHESPGRVDVDELRRLRWSSTTSDGATPRSQRRAAPAYRRWRLLQRGASPTTGSRRCHGLRPRRLSFRGGGNVELGGDMPISMKFAGDVPFALLANIMAQQGFTLTGSAKVDLSLSGPAKAPQIAGTVSTAGARSWTFAAISPSTTSPPMCRTGRQGRRRSLGSRPIWQAADRSRRAAPWASFPIPASRRISESGSTMRTYVDGTLFTANLAGRPDAQRAARLDARACGKADDPQGRDHHTGRSCRLALADRHQAPQRPGTRAADDERSARDTSAGAEASGAIAFDLAVSSPGQFFVRGRGIDADSAAI